VDEHVTLMREGDADQRFGIVLSGQVEVSIDGRRVLALGPGEVFGEQAWLDHLEHRHMMTAVSLEPSTYLEINPPALALATDEVQDLFRRQVSTVVVRRLADMARVAAQQAEPAVRGDYTATGGLDLQLVED
jgi:non-specific serine/threonine protein kinase